MADSTSTRLFEKGPVVIPFLTAGFPTRRIFVDAAMSAWENGASAIEIGMPFSDPLADGPAIQRSSQVALKQGVNLHDVMEMTATLRQRLPIPIFLMGYLNPILTMGISTFCKSAKTVGANGTIIPDCPIEESSEWSRVSRMAQLGNIFLIAPTSSDERIRQIDAASTHFSYCVAVTGVTGARKSVTDHTVKYLQRVRRLAKKQFVVGFGIAKPDHIRALSGLADGFVIGSALIPLLESSRNGAAAVGKLIKTLARAAE